MRYTVALVAILLLMGCGATTRTPNVILILIDTLRADHVHCYGYERDITPTLDSLAAEGIMWANV